MKKYDIDGNEAEPASGVTGEEETEKMTIEIKVPDIGDFTDVPVVTILVSVGDVVAEEDPLIEMESDKATMEVPSPAAGKVVELKVAEGDNVSEGTLILMLEGDAAGDAPAAAPAAGSCPGSRRGSGPCRGARCRTGPCHRPAASGKAHASPSVRAFARQLEIDLAKVNGSGRKGRILREDVTAVLKSTTAPAAAAGGAAGGMGIPPIPVVDFSKFGPTEDVDMPRIKKISGPALHRSWLNVPHVTHNDEADITDLDKYRKEMDTHGQGKRLSRDASELCHQSIGFRAEGALGVQLFDPS